MATAKHVQGNPRRRAWGLDDERPPGRNHQLGSPEGGGGTCCEFTKVNGERREVRRAILQWRFPCYWLALPPVFNYGPHGSDTFFRLCCRRGLLPFCFCHDHVWGAICPSHLGPRALLFSCLAFVKSALLNEFIGIFCPLAFCLCIVVMIEAEESNKVARTLCLGHRERQSHDQVCPLSQSGGVRSSVGP